MIRLHTEKGEISISDAALSNITGAAATRDRKSVV